VNVAGILVEHFLEQARRRFLVVAGDVKFRRRDLRRPILAIDPQIGLAEGLFEQQVVQGDAALVFAVDRRPAVDAAADQGQLFGFVEQLRE
jgi:hypothetical protein